MSNSGYVDTDPGRAGPSEPGPPQVVATTTSGPNTGGAGNESSDSQAGLKHAERGPSAFRMRSRRFFLTFPQCVVDKNDALKYIVENFNPQQVMVAAEKHKDGQPHLHILMVFAEQTTFSGAHGLMKLDGIGAKHGNYQAVRSVNKVLKYICKEDKSPAQHGFDGALAGQNLDREELIAAINLGKDAADLWKLFPEQMLMRGSSVERCVALARIASSRQSLSEWRCPEPAVPSSVSSGLSSVLSWLKSNIRTATPRPLKTPQLWIVSPPNRGKTSLILHLMTMLRVYFPVPNDGWNHDLWMDGTYDLAVMDEMTGNFCSPQDINRFADGQPCPLRRKGGQVMKNENIPLMVLSNLMPEECWPKAQSASLDAVRARFEVIWLGGEDNLFVKPALS